MPPTHVIILAAGNSTRLKSKLSKVMHPIAGRPLIDYVLSLAKSIKPKKISVVLGQDRQRVMTYLKDHQGLVFAHQRERLGTAHAVKVGLKALGEVSGPIVILNGDVPLLTPKTLRQFLKQCQGTVLGLMTTLLPNPTGYGRILREDSGEVCGIVEEKNANASQRQINEINAGVYCVAAKFLRRALAKIKRDPIKKEYYLTDMVGYARIQAESVLAYGLADAAEVLGVNTRAELAYLNQRVHDEIVGSHLTAGVGMQDPDTVYIDYGVKIGADTFLGAGVQVLGKSVIAKDCVLEPGCIVKDSRIGVGVQLKAYSYLESCVVQREAVVGPFARIRPESNLGIKSKVGNFVELKKTRLGAGSKANHLSYLGDCQVGARANIGAGTITCNYDGSNKHLTQIGDDVFIGSDSQLVAPVKIGKGAYVGSGTTVTKNVPEKALAISRVPQQNITGWKKKRGS